MEISKIREQLAQLRVSAAALRAPGTSPAAPVALADHVEAPVPEITPSRNGALALAAVKALSRQTWLALDRSREAVQKENVRTDAHHLSLENLLYERSCIQREVDKCREFPTPELDRIPLEPLAPGATLEDGTAVFVPDDERQTFLNRLRHELEARQRLERQLGERRAALAAMRAASIEKARFIESLPDHAAALRAALAPLLGHLVSAEEAASASARDAGAADSFAMLPGPLQVAHARLAAAARASAAFDAGSVASVARGSSASADTASAAALSSGSAGASASVAGSLSIAVEVAPAAGFTSGALSATATAPDAAGSRSGGTHEADAAAPAVVHVPSSRLRVWGSLLGVRAAHDAPNSGASHSAGGPSSAASAGQMRGKDASAGDEAADAAVAGGGVGAKRRRPSDVSAADDISTAARSSATAAAPGSAALAARDAIKPHPTAVSVSVALVPAQPSSTADAAGAGAGSAVAGPSPSALHIELAARPEAGEVSRIMAVPVPAARDALPLLQLQLQYLPLLNCIAVTGSASAGSSSGSASQLLCTRFLSADARPSVPASDAGLLAMAPSWLEACASISTVSTGSGVAALRDAVRAAEGSAAAGAAAVVVSPPASKRARVDDEEAGSARSSSAASSAADGRIVAWAQSLAGLASLPQPAPAAIGASLAVLAGGSGAGAGASSMSAVSGSGSAMSAAGAVSAADVLAALRLRAVASACLDECIRRMTAASGQQTVQQAKTAAVGTSSGAAAAPGTAALLAALPLQMTAEFARAQAGALASVLSQRHNGGSAASMGAPGHAHGSALARSCKANSTSVKAAAALLRALAACMPAAAPAPAAGAAAAAVAAPAAPVAPLRSSALLPAGTLSQSEFSAMFPSLATAGCLAVDCRLLRLAFAVVGGGGSSSSSGFASVLFAVPAAYPLIPAAAHVACGRSLSAAEGAALMPRPDIDADADADATSVASGASALCGALSAGLTAAASLLCPTPASLLFSLLHQAAALQTLLSPAACGTALTAAFSTAGGAAPGAAPSAAAAAILGAAASDLGAASVGPVEPLHQGSAGWTADAQLRVRDAAGAAVRIAWA